MAKKKAEGKFTLLFSCTNPRHLQVIEILNNQGQRGKARYVADAILHYESCSKTVQVKTAPALDVKAIEAVVTRLLEERTNSATEELKPHTLKPFREPEEILFDDALETLGQDGLDVISSALSDFRK